MHLHSLGGPWLEHPFWMTRFELRDPADLDRAARQRRQGMRDRYLARARRRARRPALTPPTVGAGAAVAPWSAIAPAPPRTRLEEEAAVATRLCALARHSVALLFDEARLGRALDVEGCAPLVDEIASSMQRNAGAMLGLVRLKTHDDYTFMHSVAVCTLMVVLARRMGLTEAQVREAGLAGLVHDIGKAKIPLEVLNKPGKLTPAEYHLIKEPSAPRPRHAARDTGSPSAVALDVCLHHHERPDGQGYPEGLSGEAFSPLARMGAVCDVYDAISSNRPYKVGWLPADSIAKMAEWTRAGKFDAAVFRAFIDCVGIYPVGSLVRLGSERLAVVVEHNPAHR